MGKDFDVNIFIRAKNLTGQGVKQARAQFSALEKKLQSVNRLGSKLQSIGGNIQRAGTQFALAGALTLASLAAATVNAAGFETGMAKVATLLDGHKPFRQGFRNCRKYFALPGLTRKGHRSGYLPRKKLVR